MDDIVKAMAFLGVYKSTETFRAWGLNENSSPEEVRRRAYDYIDFIKS